MKLTGLALRLLCVLCVSAVTLQTQTSQTPADFQNPPAAYRPAPIWAWNSALDDQELRRQLREFKDKGFGGYFVHARAGLATRYLGEEWLRKVAALAEEARKLGLESWIVDEDRWPSGAAGGLATRDRPEFAAVTLEYRAAAPGDLAAAVGDRATVALFDVRAEGFRRVSSSSEKVEGQLLQFLFQPARKSNRFNGEAYLDTLNPDAVAHFLKTTFTEGYDRSARSLYGAGIVGIFTDEPNFRPPMAASGAGDRGLFPWTSKLPAVFQEKRGYDLLEKLPLLVHPLPGFEQVRYDFWRTVAEQFESAFSRSYGELAAKLGLKLTGHFLAENTISSQTASTGSAMLQYLHQQIPGIDHPRRNIADPLTKKQASSVAHQFGRERVLGEVYAASGHSASFEDLKWIADYHFALGVNLLSPHLSLYSMAGERKRDFPPTISVHQPYWQHIKFLNDYLGRAAWFTTRGKSQKDTLVLEPLGSAWAHWSPGRKPESVATLERRFTETLDALLALHRDFDLGDEIILERSARIEQGSPRGDPVSSAELRVGPEGRYTVLIVPPAYRWNESTVRLIEKFLFSGGRVIFRGSQPAALQQLLTHRNAAEISEQTEELEAALEKARPREISITGIDNREVADILFQHRFDGLRHYFFLANTSREKTHRATIRVDLAGIVEEWDLRTGEVRRLRRLEHEFPPAGTFAFSVDISGTSEPMRMPQRAAEQRVETVAGPFKFRRHQPNTLVLDSFRYSLDGGAEKGPEPVWRARQAVLEAAGLGAHAGIQPWATEWKAVGPARPVRIKMLFEFESELDQPRASLVAENLGDFQVQVNGRNPGAANSWLWERSFSRVDIGSLIRRGANRIELSAAYKPGLEIEDIFVAGDFATNRVSENRYVLVAEPMELRAGNWVDQGYHFYPGNIGYQVPVDYTAGERVSLRLKQPIGAAFVVLAGTREVARLGWQPWEADVTSALKPGRNLLEVVVLGTLQNTFGPLHNDNYQKSGYDWWFSPNAFTDSRRLTSAYHHAPYGLGGVEIVRTARGAAKPQRPQRKR